MVASFPAARTSDKETLRRIFIEREERPTYDALADEFGIPGNTVKTWAADEGWQRLRIANQEKLAEKSDALGILLRATKIDQRIVEGFANVVIIAQEKIARCFADIDDNRAPSTRAQTLNTLTFAAKNLADTARACGIIGLPKGLNAEGKEDNGRWNPQLLSQINVTVQNLAAAAKAEQAEVPRGTKEPTEFE